MLPRVELAGNLVADPELRFTPAGHAVCKMRVACNDRRQNPQGEWVDGDTTFLDLTAWKLKAEACAEQFTKGSKVIVTGRLSQRSYETSAGERRTVYEVVVDEIGSMVTGTRAAPRPAPGAVENPWATAVPAGRTHVASGEEPPF
jgi:single-strand DNA-binding protein